MTNAMQLKAIINKLAKENITTGDKITPKEIEYRFKHNDLLLYFRIHRKRLTNPHKR